MLGIVVVTYNSEDVIDVCLDACASLHEAQVVVVDNASRDRTVDRVRRRPEVKLIANAHNRGFAGGVNQGVAALTTEAVLLVNPDATPVAGIDALERTVAEDGVGAATGRLVGSDGLDQHGFNVRALPTAWTLSFEVLGINRAWPGNAVNRRYRHKSPAVRVDVEQPAGAFLMLRRSVWKEIGGLDEGFFPVWFEDVDYCKRVLDRGYRIVFVPESVARHQGGHSAGKLLWKERQLVWYGSLLRYASKHFSGVSKATVCGAVVLGSFLRMMVATWQVGIAEAVSAFGGIIRLTGRCLRTGERGCPTPAVNPSSEEQLKQSR